MVSYWPNSIIAIYQISMPSLAPSSHSDFSMSEVKLNVMRAPQMAWISCIWGLYERPKLIFQERCRGLKMFLAWQVPLGNQPGIFLYQLSHSSGVFCFSTRWFSFSRLRCNRKPLALHAILFLTANPTS